MYEIRVIDQNSEFFDSWIGSKPILLTVVAGEHNVYYRIFETEIVWFKKAPSEDYPILHVHSLDSKDEVEAMLKMLL